LNDGNKYCPCRARDWKIFFDPTAFTMGAFPGFGVHVLLVQKSLKKLWQGFSLFACRWIAGCFQRHFPHLEIPDTLPPNFSLSIDFINSLINAMTRVL
jgi:hypothetical protein